MTASVNDLLLFIITMRCHCRIRQLRLHLPVGILLTVVFGVWTRCSAVRGRWGYERARERIDRTRRRTTGLSSTDIHVT